MGSGSGLLRGVGRAARAALLTAAAGTAGAAAVVGYGLAERNKFELRTETLALLPAGSPDLRILHLSDIHMLPGQELKRRWLHSLAEIEPDLVINTGDNLSHASGLAPLLDALGPLMAFPGAFVPGSNCYFAARPKNPLSYLRKRRHQPRRSPADDLPWPQMHAAFGAAGWINLTNRSQSLPVNGVRLDFSGVDDPHLNLDHFSGWPAGSTSSAKAPHLRIALTHAPYQRALDYFAGNGAQIIFAGHTHGGQVCVPGYGALVTNCDLPTWRARGLSWWEYRGNSVPLNVSAGIGTSRFAPIRIACKPEAVLVTLTAGD